MPKATIENEVQTVSNRGWRVMRIFIGILLLVAAITKAHQLATVPSLGTGILEARWFNIFVVQFELLFGIWLFVGLMPRLTWLASLACFVVFATVSAWKWISGSESCGCFGTVQVYPAWTLLLDLVVIGLLIVFRPKGIVFQWKAFFDELPELKRVRRIGFVAVAWLLLVAPVTWAMMSVENNDLAELGTEFIGADGRKTILLEPEKWVGKEFHLLPYIEPSEMREKLKTGEWTVVFYHEGCLSCEKVLVEYTKLADELHISDDDLRFAFVCVPPFTNRYFYIKSEIALHLTLRGSVAWDIKTPLQVSIQDGIVKYSDVM
jgi:uncharacterized membrane protein YphA (DoxX/SURF4 family)